MSKYSNGIIVNGENYDVIPPAPTEELRGGIIATAKGDTDTVEAKLGTDGKMYVPEYPTGMLEERIDEVSDQFDIKSASGTSIVVNDSSGLGVMGLKLYGKTEQVTTTGAQLLPYPYAEGDKTHYGVTFTDEGDGWINVKGTATGGEAAYILASNIDLQVEDGDVITIYKEGTGDINNIQVAGWASTWAQFFTDASLLLRTNMHMTGNIRSKNVLLRLSIDEGATVNGKIRVMINAGSVALPYEPYTGGASPNPDYPQPLESKGKWGNLFDKAAVTKGYELILNNGTISANPNYFVSDYIPVEYGKSYFVSGKTGTSGIALYDSNKEYVGRIEKLGNESFSISNQIVAYIRTNDLLQDLDSIMLNEGTTALPYRPYSGQLEVESGVLGGNLIDLNNEEVQWAKNVSDKLLNVFNSLKVGTYYYNFKVKLTSVNSNFKTNDEYGIFAEHPAVDRYILNVFKSWNTSTIGTVKEIKGTFEITEEFVGKFTKIYLYGSGNMTTGATGTALFYDCIISNFDIPYEPYTKQSHISLVGDGLKGIPVTDASLATYTDENGQMWCSDYVDCERGVRVEKFKKLILDGTNTDGVVYFKNQTSQSDYDYYFYSNDFEIDLKGGCLCDKLMYKAFRELGGNSQENMGIAINGVHKVVFINLGYLMTVNTIEEFKKLLAENPLTVIVPLETPIETPLTASEIESYKNLCSNYHVTTVMNDCNCYTVFNYMHQKYENGLSDVIDKSLEPVKEQLDDLLDKVTTTAITLKDANTGAVYMIQIVDGQLTMTEVV